MVRVVPQELCAAQRGEAAVGLDGSGVQEPLMRRLRRRRPPRAQPRILFAAVLLVGGSPHRRPKAGKQLCGGRSTHGVARHCMRFLSAKSANHGLSQRCCRQRSREACWNCLRLPGVFCTCCDVSRLEGLGNRAVLRPIDGGLPGPGRASSRVTSRLHRAAWHARRGVSRLVQARRAACVPRREQRWAKGQPRGIAAVQRAAAAAAERWCCGHGGASRCFEDRSLLGIMQQRGSPSRPTSSPVPAHLVVKAVHGKQGWQVVLGAGAVPLPAAATVEVGRSPVQCLERMTWSVGQ